MELFTFETFDARYNVIAHATTEEEVDQLTSFSKTTGVYGQWDTRIRDNYLGVRQQVTICYFDNVDRNTMVLIQLGLK